MTDNELAECYRAGLTRGPKPHTDKRLEAVALLRMGVTPKRAAYVVGRSESFVRNAMAGVSAQSTIHNLRLRLAESDKELADHKQRLAAQSARLAAAESEVRMLRQWSDDACDLLRRLADVTCDEDAEECFEMVDKLEAE